MPVTWDHWVRDRHLFLVSSVSPGLQAFVFQSRINWLRREGIDSFRVKFGILMCVYMVWPQNTHFSSSYSEEISSEQSVLPSLRSFRFFSSVIQRKEKCKNFHSVFLNGAAVMLFSGTHTPKENGGSVRQCRPWWRWTIISSVSIWHMGSKRKVGVSCLTAFSLPGEPPDLGNKAASSQEVNQVFSCQHGWGGENAKPKIRNRMIKFSYYHYITSFGSLGSAWSSGLFIVLEVYWQRVCAKFYRIDEKLTPGTWAWDCSLILIIPNECERNGKSRSESTRPPSKNCKPKAGRVL